MADQVTLDDLYQLIGRKDAIILQCQKETAKAQRENEGLKKDLAALRAQNKNVSNIGKKPNKKG